MGNISNIINDYVELNKLYCAVAVSNSLLFEQQKRITEFWQEHYDVPNIENCLLQTIAEVGYRQTDAVFLQLKKVVTENIALYATNASLFSSFDTVDICRRFADRYREQIQEQTKITTTAHKRLIEAENALDYISSDADDSNATSMLIRRNEAKEKHDTEQRRLQMLHTMADLARQEAVGCSENLFERIYELGVLLISVLDKYIIDNRTIHTEKTASTVSDSAVDIVPAPFTEYFPMNLLAEIHAECVKTNEDDFDGKQFEPIPVVDFYYAMNLGDVQPKLAVAPDEKVRVCHLLRRLRDRLPAGQREKWLSAILERLRINRGTFTSKTAEVGKRYASRANVEFTTKTDAIFKRMA